jgi:alanine racemase
VEIDLSAIASNMHAIRRAVGPKPKIMAIVKADGYGHGALQTARTALASGADCLGVAIYEEGAELRESGIDRPILILGYTTPNEQADAIRGGLTQTVFNMETAQAISKTAVALGKSARVHIKVDTGMSRLGFIPSAHAADCIYNIAELPGIEITGMFTHFALSDGPDDAFTLEQFKRFTGFARLLEARGLHIPVLHCCNSAALLDEPSMHLDMVRAGIILYGLEPSEYKPLDGLGFRPAMSLRAHISMVKRVGVGVSVSYGRKFVTERETVIATIPVGYADGYRRSMSNRARVLVHGEYAPVIGTVCMDQFMTDVTDIPGVTAGDEAVLMGRDGQNQITADEIARIQNTINYEVVCGISKRVPRYYINAV